MSTSPQPQAAISPAQFELKRLRSSIHAVTRISGSSPLVEALQAVEHLFEIVLPDPNQQPVKPPVGLTPEYIDPSKSALERTREITEAIHRYAANGVLVPIEWVGELVMKVEQLEKAEAACPKWVHVWPKPNGVGRVDGDRNIVLYFPRELSDNEMRSLLDMAQHHAQLVPNKQPEAPVGPEQANGPNPFYEGYHDDETAALRALRLRQAAEVEVGAKTIVSLRELIAEAHDELKFTLEAAYRAGNEGAPRVHRLVAKLAVQKVPAPPCDAGVTVLPDGSAFATGSMPLPADHWLTAPACEVWDKARDESADLPYPILSRLLQSQVVDAARWAIRAATMRGQCQDFDPDAMVQNFTYALCGPAFKTAVVRKADHFSYTTSPQPSPTASSPVVPE